MLFFRASLLCQTIALKAPLLELQPQDMSGQHVVTIKTTHAPAAHLPRVGACLGLRAHSALL